MPSNKKPMKREVAQALAIRVCDELQKMKVVVKICGSLRRKRPIVNDVDMVVSVPSTKIYEILRPRFGMSAILTKKGDKYGNFVIEGVQFDFNYASPESWGAMVLFATGSGLFNIIMRGIAKNQNMKLNERGLWFGEDMIAGRDEKQIFDALGLEWLDPKDREVTPENRKARWLKEKEVA
jgi:DNA polymerase (family 10)